MVLSINFLVLPKANFGINGNFALILLKGGG